jgi:hypothetical protein
MIISTCVTGEKQVTDGKANDHLHLRNLSVDARDHVLRRCHHQQWHRLWKEDVEEVKCSCKAPPPERGI